MVTTRQISLQSTKRFHVNDMIEIIFNSILMDFDKKG